MHEVQLQPVEDRSVKLKQRQDEATHFEETSDGRERTDPSRPSRPYNSNPPSFQKLKVLSSLSSRRRCCTFSVKCLSGNFNSFHAFYVSLGKNITSILYTLLSHLGRDDLSSRYFILDQTLIFSICTQGIR